MENMYLLVLSYFNKDNKIKSFLCEENFKDCLNEMIEDSFDSIIYFHNGGRFDSIIILRELLNSNKYDVKVIERNNIIYNINLYEKNSEKEILSIRDSILLLPISLSEISSLFDLENKKDSEFDYNNMIEIYSLNPSLIVDQCEKDCKALREGFNLFRKMIKKIINTDVVNHLTLPSLAYNLFRGQYYNIEKTLIGKNPPDNDSFIRNSYFGGISDVFKPYLENGYCYDANSLYPFIMRKEKFPIGKPSRVRGENIDIDNFIGFIYCDVSNKNSKSFLVYKDLNRGLITPKGKWTGTYFHKEIIKGIELGYEFKFLSGLKYESEDYIFNDYVNNLYKIRIDNKDNKSINKIFKLLLNSLYGRFGMKLNVEQTKCLSYEDVVSLKKSHSILNIRKISGTEYYILQGVKADPSYKSSIDVETAVQNSISNNILF
jgi:hypothetical protein